MTGIAPVPPGASVEPEPAIAELLFGDHIESARRFTSDLVVHGETLGLIGPLEASRIWSRHIVNSALLAPRLTAGARVADVGSGAGLPGLVLAIARPDVHLILIEPMERRVDWLEAETARLGLTNVAVLRARAEDVPRAMDVDQLTARAVKALSKLLPLVVPLVRDGGELLLLKGAGVEAEAAAAENVMKKLRLSDISILLLGEEVAAEPTRVFRALVRR